MAGVMWVLEVIDQLADNRLDQYGIEPRDADGLIGVVAAPFLHGGFDHLVGNTVPFLLMGFVIAAQGAARVVAVTVIVALVSGLGTWLIAPEHTIHIGASGIVFGYASYLISRGFFNRNALELAVGALVAWSTAARCWAASCPRTACRGRATSSARSAASWPPAGCLRGLRAEER